MKKIPGAMSAKTFDRLHTNQVIYVVYSDGTLEKKVKRNLSVLIKGSDWDNPNSGRRAFKNYLHAYAFSLRRKDYIHKTATEMHIYL